jgi:hypothetical protein
MNLSSEKEKRVSERQSFKKKGNMQHNKANSEHKKGQEATGRGTAVGGEDEQPLHLLVI